MNICVDGYAALNLPGTFIGSYSSELVKQLTMAEIPHMIHVIFEDSNYKNFLGKKSWYVPVNLDMYRKTNNYESLEKYIYENGIEIYHSLNNGFSIPENKCCSYVITIHSLYAIENKSKLDEKYYNKFLSIFPEALEKADKIIAVSYFIKNELIRLFNIDESKITVIYPIISSIYRPLSYNQCKNFLINKYGIKNPYIYYCGNIHQSKNLDKLIQLFKTISIRCRDLKLVISGDISGKKNEYYKDLLSLSEKLDIKDNVIFTGLIPKEDTVYFYNKAKCVISLSEYDGYPLSLSEAALCKTPVICNNIPVVREVLNNCAVTCDLSKPNQIVDFVYYLCTNNEFRSNLINKISIPLSSSVDDYINFYS
ncbi:Glycosyltransferase involved in cell wall bisynthesis [Clostridium amylolyticum]|uniref:Glycosyltransferase involved in cell wall bisynthesis n=1 Tax=Clostridium amylolyticum TaxID=1121298 RepID=A0A1M6B3S4_9CLOT|nr:glycosyltransferase family 1 protein [Clostridium amylolyticum]SHI43103.1 Glycosyltransferase involved in cell wall bisynthesis [Clostridium amylolyticum]